MAEVRRIYLTLEEVAEALSLSEATVQALVRRKELPPPRLLSGRRVGWLVREVEEWAESRPPSDLLPPPNTHSKKPRLSTEQKVALAAHLNA